MEIRNYLKYIRFINIVRSFHRGEITKREILIAVGVLIALRLVIYFGFHYM